MSEDLIRRSDAIDAVMNTEPVFAVDSLEPYQKTKDVVEALEAIPTIEPKRGEWIDFKNGWKCSACGKWNNEMSNFCPNCGADMRGE